MFENVQQLVETAALGMAAMVFCLALLGVVFSWLVRDADTQAAPSDSLDPAPAAATGAPRALPQLAPIGPALVTP